MPCVAYAASLDEVAALVAAGADFVALGDWIWREPQRVAAQIAAAAQALAPCRRPRHDRRAAQSRRRAGGARRTRARAARLRAAETETRAAGAAAASSANEPDLAYGEFQRGRYLTALAEATKRAQKNDPAAMTLLGEIYANGYGVGRDDSKAAQWYKLAAAGGDRNAMFALAMFDFDGRAGPRNEAEGARLLAAAAKLGHLAAAYDLGLLYLQGKQFPQDFARAASCFARPPMPDNPEAQYALATMYKEGRGVNEDIGEAMKLMQKAAIAGDLDAMVEFAIAAIQRHRHGPRTRRPPPRCFVKAARRGSAIAQDRLARILMAGRGMPADPANAIKWHLIAKAAGDKRPRARCLRRQATAGRARCRRQGRAEVDVDAAAAVLTAHAPARA